MAAFQGSALVRDSMFGKLIRMKTLLLAGLATLSWATVAARAQDAAEAGWTAEEVTTGIRKIEFTRHVLSGVTTNLGTFYGLTKSCDQRDEQNEYEVMQEPEHGTVELEHAVSVVNLAKNSSFAHCNGKKAPGISIKYKAKDGYEGKDELAVLEISPRGMSFERIAHIIVHKRSKSR
jgi:hypothetical protein